MTGEIVNLRQARKRRKRDERDEVAQRNRAMFGRPKAERELQRRNAEQDAARLDAHRRGESDR
ncbi:MAG: DUF4169 family protein [Rhizobiaceae bacterium]